MNPLGLFLIALGLILIIIGFKGSQHNVVAAIKGIRGGSQQHSKGKALAPGPLGGNTIAPGGINPSTGRGNI